MSMSLEELRAKATTHPQLEVEDEEEEDDTEPFILDEVDSATAVDLLRDAMRLLGFFSDRKLSGNIVIHDRERMRRVAEEIEAFVSTLDLSEE